MDHVSTEIAANFFSGRLPREENRRVVRHLLGQCPACLRLFHSLDPLYATKPGKVIPKAIGRHLGRSVSGSRPLHSRA